MSRPTPSSSGHQRSSVNGAVCCAQPKGESHDSQSRSPPWTADMSPSPRTMKNTARIAPAMPEQARANAESCAVTAATPANTQPTAPMLAPKSRAEENGRGAASE